MLFLISAFLDLHDYKNPPISNIYVYPLLSPLSNSPQTIIIIRQSSLSNAELFAVKQQRCDENERHVILYSHEKRKFQAQQLSFEKYKTLIKATSLNNYNNYRSM